MATRGDSLFATRTAAALRDLDHAGFTVEAYALLRNLIVHVHAMAWLLEAGPAGLRALEADNYLQRMKIYAEARVQCWSAVENAPEPEPPEFAFADEAESKRHATLLGQLQNASNLFPALGAADMYTVYRVLSRYAHSSAESANAFLNRGTDGKVRLRPTAADAEDSHARVIWTAVSLLHSGAIISPLIEGDPLREDLKCGADELGLPPDVLKAPAD